MSQITDLVDQSLAPIRDELAAVKSENTLLRNQVGDLEKRVAQLEGRHAGESSRLVESGASASSVDLSLATLQVNQSLAFLLQGARKEGEEEVAESLKTDARI